MKNNMEATLIKTEVNYILEDENGVIIASTSLNKEGLSLSVKNCQEIELGYDLDDLAELYSTMTIFIKKDEIPTAKQIEDAEYISEIAFKAGAKTILELMADKKYSEEDMYKMFIYARSIDTAKKHIKKLEDKPIDEFFNDFIQSLQQNEWKVKIETEKEEYVLTPNGEGFEDQTYRGWRNIPKFDEGGCLILKRI